MLWLQVSKLYKEGNKRVLYMVQPALNDIHIVGYPGQVPVEGQGLGMFINCAHGTGMQPNVHFTTVKKGGPVYVMALRDIEPGTLD